MSIPDIDESSSGARLVYPDELRIRDAIRDAAGVQRHIAAVAPFHDGKAVMALLDDRHRVWFWNDEPVTAVLRRDQGPSLTCYARVLDASDEEGWAAGEPAVIDTEQDSMTWEPDYGNPVIWALDALKGWGTLEPSSSPPYDQRTWYTTTWTDWQRLGATVDVSAHLTGFTRAEAEQIGQRVTAPPTAAHPAPITRLADRSAHRTRVSNGTERRTSTDRGLSR